MLRWAMTRGAKRFGRGIPVVELLLAAEVAMLARRHVRRLTAVQRRRLVALVRKAKGRPSVLGAGERDELADLVARLEPRLFAGTAVRRLSPLPLPKRLLYGPRGSPARRALKERGR
jgi:hypothetical protein